MRTTIDFGIDLGTTNSSIALWKGGDTEVFRNNEGFDYTPSAVWIDKANRLLVGRRAKERFFDDQDNAACEFKLQMGSAEEKVFQRSGRRMKPEELSAEVLKQLKADVRQRTGEEVEAAVITVPAAFELPQCKATQQAGQLAGLRCCPLLQEPVAAALAYGSQSLDAKVFWLVYDFGGGTFDAAIIHMRDGVFQVVNHGGDNHLGGKLIDWEIVNQLLVPAVTREHRLSEFHHGSKRWIAAFAKLKLAAEEAKIRVSRDESAEVIIDYLCNDDNGEPVRVETELTKADVERIAEPFILRSINICKRALEEKRLGVENVEKVLLVGGPTLMPYLRERLADPKDGLGIPLEFGVDPLTAVARGAAIFAGTRRLEKPATTAPAAQGQYTIQLDYQPVGPDTEPLVGGRVQGRSGESLAGFTIEFVNCTSPSKWRSGKITLGADGGFVTNLWAEKGPPTVFQIELSNATGTRQTVAPQQLTYVVGVGTGDPVLIHSVGIALATNETVFFLKKGAALPARHRGQTLHTVSQVKRGQQGHLLRIPVVEGEHGRRADRNRLIGMLEIPSDKIRRDLPAGSEIELTIDIDESRLVRTKAYVPLLDEEYESVVHLAKAAPDLPLLKQQFEIESRRLEQAHNKSAELGEARARTVLKRIQNERIQEDIQSALQAAVSDVDAGYRCRDRLLDLRSAIDEAEDAMEWPSLLAQADKEIEFEGRLMEDQTLDVTGDERMAFNTIKREIETAKRLKDADLLRAKVDEMDRLGRAILQRQPGWWVGALEHLEQRKSSMLNQQRADEFSAQGRRAIESNDLPGLKTAVRGLANLLPPTDPDRNKYYESSVMR